MTLVFQKLAYFRGVFYEWPDLFVACRNMKKFEGELPEEIRSEEKCISARYNPDCPNLTDGMEAGATYMFEEDNWYRVADKWWEYVDWVVKLSKLVGLDDKMPEKNSNVAFRDLFRYGNRAGTFGPISCKKLAMDFFLWDDLARTFDDRYFYRMFRLMRGMFEFGAQDGAVWLRSC
jgi:hypothetical protein